MEGLRPPVPDGVYSRRIKCEFRLRPEHDKRKRRPALNVPRGGIGAIGPAWIIRTRYLEEQNGATAPPNQSPQAVTDSRAAGGGPGVSGYPEGARACLGQQYEMS